MEIKIMSARNAEQLEKDIADYLNNNEDKAIINIQYQATTNVHSVLMLVQDVNSMPIITQVDEDNQPVT